MSNQGKGSHDHATKTNESPRFFADSSRRELALPKYPPRESQVFRREMIGTSYPIRRLVVTGKDTEENLQLLLGPNLKGIGGPKPRNARREVNLRPPPESDEYKSYCNGDEHAPYWSPRPTTTEEIDEFIKKYDPQELDRINRLAS